MSSVQRTTPRRRHHRDGQGDRLLGCLQHESRGQGLRVVATGHQGDVDPVLEQPGADDAPDGAGTENDDPHACTLPRHGDVRSSGGAYAEPELCSATALGGRWPRSRCASSAAWPHRHGSTSRAAAPGDRARAAARADVDGPGRVLSAARRGGPDGARGSALHADRRHQRAAVADAAPAGHGGRGGALQLPGRPVGETPPHGRFRRHHHLRHGARGRGRRCSRCGGCTDASRASRPTAGPIRPATPSWSPSSMWPRCRASSSRPGASARAPHPRAVRPVLRGSGPRGARTGGQVGTALGGRRGRLLPPRYAPSSTPARRRSRRVDWLRHGREPASRASVPSTPCCMAAAVSLLPPWARRELGPLLRAPLDLLVDTVAVIPDLAGRLRRDALAGHAYAPAAAQPQPAAAVTGRW